MWLKGMNETRLSDPGGEEHRHVSDVRSGVDDVIARRQQPPRALADRQIKNSLLKDLATDQVIEIDFYLHSPRQFYRGLVGIGP